MITHEYRTRVYYRDVDQMGIVYYSRYLEYFEAARTECLNAIGLDVSTIEENGFYLPVISAHCDYKEGARFEDELVVRTHIREMPRLKLTIEYTVSRAGSDATLVSGYTVHVFIDRQSGKPHKPPPAVRLTFDRYFTQ